MRNIWFISDSHFGHKNILTFKNYDGTPTRTFDSVEEMNELMIQNINAVVKPTDILYHLGDVYFGSVHDADKLMDRVNGKKRLILGNHDEITKKNRFFYEKHFEKILVWRIFKDEGLIFSHVPLHPSAFDYKDLVNAHGHVHGNSVRRPDGYFDEKYINMCVENTNYHPVNLDEVKTFVSALG